MAQKSFSAQLDAFAMATRARVEAVFKESARRTISLAQSYVPVDTGFLRASVRASLDAMPPIDPGARPTLPGYNYDAGDVVLTIAGARLGDTIYAGWTASYAGHVNNGTSNMAPVAFVDRAAMSWQATVNQVSSDLRDRSG